MTFPKFFFFIYEVNVIEVAVYNSISRMSHILIWWAVIQVPCKAILILQKLENSSRVELQPKRKFSHFLLFTWRQCLCYNIAHFCKSNNKFDRWKDSKINVILPIIGRNAVLNWHTLPRQIESQKAVNSGHNSEIIVFYAIQNPTKQRYWKHYFKKE